MDRQSISISGIPAILWGKASDRAYIHVHGKLGRKEDAQAFAEVADAHGFQTLSFDLPEHGERAGRPDRYDVWNGVRDLNLAADFAFEHFSSVSLFACSLGAYFALNAYADRALEKCLFQSPIVDMKWLVEQMMRDAGVTPQRLEREGGDRHAHRRAAMGLLSVHPRASGGDMALPDPHTVRRTGRDAAGSRRSRLRAGARRGPDRVAGQRAPVHEAGGPVDRRGVASGQF